jgi:hypothetical protein
MNFAVVRIFDRFCGEIEMVERYFAVTVKSY